MDKPDLSLEEFFWSQLKNFFEIVSELRMFFFTIIIIFVFFILLTWNFIIGSFLSILLTILLWYVYWRMSVLERWKSELEWSERSKKM